MSKTLKFTANDTFPTTLTFATTDPETGIQTPTDIAGYTVAMEIDYSPTPLVKTAVLQNPTTSGKCDLNWSVGDLREGTPKAKIVVTNASSKKISTEFITLKIDKDITP